MKDKYNQSSRYDKRAKRKKTNIVLNGLIGLVILLIIVVSVIIFSGGNDNEAGSKNGVEKNEEQKGTNEEKQPVEEEETKNNEEEEKDDSETTDESKDEGNIDDEEIVTEGGSDSNVIRTIENPAWEPVGTTQTGEHPTAVYDSNSVDWDEMLNAITHATGLDKSSMTVNFLGNNGPNRSIGTVFSPGKEQMYRVYIEWVDGQGWKPTKVEELSSL
ncbi:YrrS family protein [Cytobacillus purgationiresistens]|uniref:Cytoskeletal protein RodZ n=1 Tax=Cytobacillus purgationiresistens TaxID=863449 RepID=A0ABU0AE75_9BACI|nr:YrrS family protein [Cytobacillus purgationiresistens]MDQ0269546.1 cytoskeletal protein RodZ [Cytobacillus purgationiresistens]